MVLGKEESVLFREVSLYRGSIVGHLLSLLSYHATMWPLKSLYLLCGFHKRCSLPSACMHSKGYSTWSVCVCVCLLALI